MLIIIIFAFAGAILVGMNSDIGEAFMGAAFGAAFGAVAAALCGVIFYSGSHWAVESTTLLVNIGDGGPAAHGGFFLGSGTIDSDPVFTWYQKESNNAFVRKFSYAYDSTIHYIAPGRRPYYTHSAKFYNTKRFVQTFALTIDGDTGDEHYDFYVPQGSITREFKLDNQ